MFDEVTLKIAVEVVQRLKESPRAITWTWDTIKGYGATKALKTSYLFLFIVPVLARALVSMPETVTIPVWGKTFEIAIALPFSWVLLFISACLASLGNIIYAIMCPSIIKEFSDFPSFNAAQRDGTYLRRPVRQLALVSDITDIMGQLKSVRDLYNNVPIEFQRLERTMNGDAEILSSEFYFVRDAANLGRPLARLLASLAYFGAFICLGIIAVQNINYVVAYMRGIGAAG